MTDIEKVQRFVRLQRAHKRLKTIPIIRDIYHNTRTFEEFQNIMLERQTRLITYSFLREAMKSASIQADHKMYSKWVSVFLSAFLIHTFPDEVLSKSRELLSEKAIFQTANVIVNRVCVISSSKLCYRINEFITLFEEFRNRFDTWLMEDRQCQLNVLCEMIVQLRTHGPNTTNKEVRNTYIENAKEFEKTILNHIRKIAGDSGIEFVQQFIQGVEKAQIQIASKVHKTMHRVYWDLMKEQLSKPQNRISCVIILVKEMIKQLHTLVPSDEYRINLQNDIDVDYLELKMLNETFTVEVLQEVVTSISKQVLLICSPAQDPDIVSQKEKTLEKLRSENDWTCVATFFQMMNQHVEYISEQLKRLRQTGE